MKATYGVGAVLTALAAASVIGVATPSAANAASGDLVTRPATVSTNNGVQIRTAGLRPADDQRFDVARLTTKRTLQSGKYKYTITVQGWRWMDRGPFASCYEIIPQTLKVNGNNVSISSRSADGLVATFYATANRPLRSVQARVDRFWTGSASSGCKSRPVSNGAFLVSNVG